MVTYYKSLEQVPELLRLENSKTMTNFSFINLTNLNFSLVQQKIQKNEKNKKLQHLGSKTP